MKRKPAAGPPPPRNAILGIRLRKREYYELRAVAHAHEMPFSEWARGVLLKELPNAK